ncbi:SLATT domain-containing protein [Mesorhizobium sp. M0048]|uniref:SLATT domain-containing protein n=1 Tax=Mesorhizobium sp. M0048 TaxID=2956860 RepID=UPI00333595B2
MPQEKGDTFSTLNAQLANIKQEDFATFFDFLYGAVEKLKTDRENFYRSLRTRNSWWINTSRWTLGTLGAAALLLTALAGIAAIAAPQEGWFKGWQIEGLFWAFVIYAVMGAIALFERGTDLSAAYFRHLTITIAIRNLWNEFQLTILKEYPALLETASADKKAARERAIELARALCKDIDTLVSTEQTEWRTEFMDSLKELETAAKDGIGAVKTDLQAAMDKVTKAAEEATKAAEQAKAALLPGDLNVTVTGSFDGNLVVLVDQAKRHDKPVMKKFAIRGIVPGTREIEVKAKKGAQDINLSEVVEVKPGLQNYTVALA